MKEVYDFIKKCGTYYLATVDGDIPHVRPFGTINMFDGKLYIQTGKKKDCSKQIHKNPNVELTCFDGNDWIRLSGKLVEDTRFEAKKSMLDNYPNLRAMYDENDGNTEVFYFQDAVATIYSFSKEPKTYKI